ncbi:MAG: diphthamide biosynthesis enzyme Dph2, partial [Patescibacteria group bacterium]|nr:diphthamide biosynthesis enzyme Dph2 [Patescibacteria group bacterium]
IEKLSVDVLIFADPCFGACDVSDVLMERAGCDLAVHVGHSEMIRKLSIPVVYVEYYSSTDAAGILEREMKKLDGFKSISLVTTIQHIGQIDSVSELLLKFKKKVYVGKPSVAKYPGQVLGCDQSAALCDIDKVDCVLYFGTGWFHAIGIARRTDKLVFLLSLEDGKMHDLRGEHDVYLRKKIILKHKFECSKRVCIVASSKAGQMNKNVVGIKRKIEKTGKCAFVAVMDAIEPDKLLGMDYDIIVNTACPRIEDDVVFRKPVINVADVFE